MTLDEANALADEGLIGTEPEENDTTDYWEPLMEAISLLEDARHLLGFLGDKKLSKKIQDADRTDMRAMAEEIEEFVGPYVEAEHEERPWVVWEEEIKL